jgi:hypothetical protein
MATLDSPGVPFSSTYESGSSPQFPGKTVTRHGLRYPLRYPPPRLAGSRRSSHSLQYPIDCPAPQKGLNWLDLQEAGQTETMSAECCGQRFSEFRIRISRLSIDERPAWDVNRICQ